MIGHGKEKLPDLALFVARRDPVGATCRFGRAILALTQVNGKRGKRARLEAIYMKRGSQGSVQFAYDGRGQLIGESNLRKR